MVALVLSLHAVPARGTPPTTLKLQWREAWNRHHRFGGDGERLASTVVLKLKPGGQARVEDSGKRKRSQLDRTGDYKADRQTWTLRWRGRWKRSGRRLLLDLQREQRTCERVIARPGQPDEKPPCAAAPKALKLVCEADRVPLSGGSKREARAWRCRPRGHASTGGSPLPWVFGREGCLRSGRDPRHRLRHAPCE